MGLGNATSSFVRLLYTHRSWLSKHAARRLQPKLRVKIPVSDVTQEVITGVAAQGRVVMEEGAIVPLHYRLLQSLADVLHNHVRLFTRPPRNINREVSLDDDRGLVGELAIMSSDFHNVDIRDVVQTALARLDHVDREIILLRGLERWTFAQIAERIQCTQNAAKQRYCRAVPKLKAILEAIDSGYDST